MKKEARPTIDPGFDDLHLHRWVTLLIRLRWFAISATCLAVLFAQLTHLVHDANILWIVVGWMVSYNSVLWLWWRARSVKDRPAFQTRSLVLLQLLFDVLTHSVLLHYSDSVENPTVMFFVFPVAAAAMLLPIRHWVIVTIATSLFHAGSVVLEHFAIIGHHPLAGMEMAIEEDPIFRSGFLVAGYVGAFVVTIHGVALLVHILARERRNAEAIRRQRDRLAISRERLAHVGQIAAGVAHSVRNPLHGLINSVDLLASRSAEAGTQRVLARMTGALQRIDNITRRLLVLTREAPLSRRKVEIGDLILNSIELLSDKIVAKIAVDKGAEEIGIAEIDPQQLSEALANVLDNAADACGDDGSVALSGWTSSADGEETIHIEVRDDGPGISPELLPHVFDPFITTKEVGKGTGLGLAITKRVVEEHGGSVTVDLPPEGGTRVELVFPRYEEAGRGRA